MNGVCEVLCASLTLELDWCPETSRSLVTGRKANRKRDRAAAGARDEAKRNERIGTEDEAADTTSQTELVPEVPHAGENHGEPRFVGGGDHLLVADRTAGLDHRRRARLRRR